MRAVARWHDLSYRRGKRWPAARVQLGVGYRWPAASVAYCLGFAFGGRPPYCRGLPLVAGSSSRRSTCNRRLMKRLAAVLFCSLAQPLAAVTFTVINTDDSGAGSLRQAILDANGTPGFDTIAFNIPGAGVHTITPASGLPTISDPAIIDGYTPAGSQPEHRPQRLQRHAPDRDQRRQCREHERTPHQRRREHRSRVGDQPIQRLEPGTRHCPELGWRKSHRGQFHRHRCRRHARAGQPVRWHLGSFP